MATINERIKDLRKQADITQADFANRLGLKQGAVSKLEKPGNTVTEQNIRIICDKFGVSRSWLEQGEGEMFLPPSEPSALEQLTKEYNLSSEQQVLMKAFLELPESYCDVILKAARMLVEKAKKEGTMLTPEEAAAQKAAEKSLPPEAMAEIEEEAAKIKQEMIEEKRRELTSTGASCTQPGAEKSSGLSKADMRDNIA